MKQTDVKWWFANFVVFIIAFGISAMVAWVMYDIILYDILSELDVIPYILVRILGKMLVVVGLFASSLWVFVMLFQKLSCLIRKGNNSVKVV